jgi:hypothetical protein
MTTTTPESSPDAAADTAVALYDPEQAALAQQEIYATGDLSKLTGRQRVAYYLRLCETLGLNSLSRPFDWLVLDEKLVLYPNKSCTEQLRRNHRISVKITRRDIVGDLFVVECEGRTPDGRTDEASKYVPLTGFNSRTGMSYRLTGDRLSSAFMKAETGAKRRLTLSMVGLAGLPDLDDVNKIRVVTVDADGNVLEASTDEERYLAEHPSVARVIGKPTFETQASADDSPIEGQSQAPTPEELEPVKRTLPRQSFRPDEDEIGRRTGAFFKMIKGTSLDDQETRHTFVRQLGGGAAWPPRKQSENIHTVMARATDDEAASFLNQTRIITDREKAVTLREIEQATADDDGDDAVEPDTLVEPF